MAQKPTDNQDQEILPGKSGKTAMHKAIEAADKNITTVRLKKGEHDDGADLRKAERDRGLEEQWK